MSVKITELPILSELADNDVIAGVDVSGNVTSKIEMETLKGYIDTNTQYTAGTNIDITNNVISAPDVPTKEEFDSLSTIFNAFPTESDEDESMTLDGTAEVKFKKFDLKGNTSQYSTTGKNLLPINNDSQTRNGLTFTKNADDSWTISGTASDNTYGNFYLSTSSSIVTDTSKTYTFSIGTSKTNVGVAIYEYVNGSWTNKKYIYSSSTTYTPSGTQTGQMFRVAIANGTNLTTPITVYPMLVEGTNVGDYEPYVGGTASPNPSYPQDVNVVSGDNEINICGENLFHSDGINLATLSGITSSFDSSSISLNGSNTSAGYVISNRTATNITLEAGTYYFSIFLLSGSINRGSNQGEFTIVTPDGRTGITLSNIINSPSGYTKSFTATEKTTLETDFYLNGAITFTNAVLGIEISKQTPTTYEPYTGNTYNIDLPVENLFDKNGDLMLNCRLANDGGNFSEAGYYISEYIPINPNTTYTKNSPTADYAHRVCFFSNNDTTSFVSKSENNTFTTPSNAKYLRFCGLQSELDITQLEVGSKQNNFTPYGTTPIELCKIGNYQDYIYKDSDKWYLHKEIGKYNIDTSTLGIKTNYTNIEYATIPKPNNYLGYGSFDKVEIICKSASHIAQAPSGWNDVNLVNKISGNPEANRWWLGFSKGTGITAIQNALNGSYIYYPLATPTTTEITYQPLIDQLNLLEKAMSKDSQTNISQVNNDLGFIIYAEAIQSLSNVLDRLSLLE